MQNWIPIPRSWREALWLAVAIFIATRKGIKNGIVAFYRTWVTAPAQAEKILAEAESIRTKDVVSTAETIRELSMSLGKLQFLTGQLTEQVASQASIIELQKVKIESLEKRNSELEERANIKHA